MARTSNKPAQSPEQPAPEKPGTIILHSDGLEVVGKITLAQFSAAADENDAAGRGIEWRKCDLSLAVRNNQVIDGTGEPITLLQATEAIGVPPAKSKAGEAVVNPIVNRWAGLAEYYPIGKRPKVTVNQAILLYELREQPVSVRQKYEAFAEKNGKPALLQKMYNDGVKKRPKTDGDKEAKPIISDAPPVAAVTTADGSKVTTLPTVGKIDSPFTIVLDQKHYESAQAIAVKSGIPLTAWFKRMIDAAAANMLRLEAEREEAARNADEPTDDADDADDADEPTDAEPTEEQMVSAAEYEQEVNDESDEEVDEEQKALIAAKTAIKARRAGRVDNLSIAA